MNNKPGSGTIGGGGGGVCVCVDNFCQFSPLFLSET